MFSGFVLLFSWISFGDAESAERAFWKAGTSRVKITPEIPIWMSGYASRTAPAEGTRVELWAKALALSTSNQEDEGMIIITMDLVGMGRDLSLDIRESIGNALGLSADQIQLCFSHTHTGPVVGANLRTMYFLNQDQWHALEEYESELKKKVLTLAQESWEKRTRAKLAWANGRATFGVNRRNNREVNVPALRRQGELVGPVDYTVPTLAVRNPEGELSAVVFGYACHSTTLSDQLWSGDYPGYAQLELESRYSGIQAMFWAGCGADINPLPRRKPELAENYGVQLAGAVSRTLAGVMQPISPALQRSSQEIELPFEKIPSREEWNQQSESSNKYVASRANYWLDHLETGAKIPESYPYPITILRLGSAENRLNWLFLGGEVVVDFAIQARSRWGSHFWVSSYTQDVMGYIPSRRVWDEGGYEGDTSSIYYGLPSRWSGDVEEWVWQGIETSLQSLNSQLFQSENNKAEQ